MDYQKAHDYIYNEIGEEGVELLILLAEDKIVEGISLIRNLTSCDENVAKMLWIDLKCDYGTSEHNPIMQVREELSPQEIARNNAIAREWQNKPKCPTCSSTNVKKISGTAKLAGAVAFGLLSKTARSQFKCNNCGYKW